VDGWKTEGKEEDAGSLQNGRILGGLGDQNVTVREPTPERCHRSANYETYEIHRHRLQAELQTTLTERRQIDPEVESTGPNRMQDRGRDDEERGIDSCESARPDPIHVWRLRLPVLSY
jgi:hypothetical protein